MKILLIFALSGAIALQAAPPELALYPVRPVSALPVLPETQLAYGGVSGRPLRITATPGEYEPASVVAVPDREMPDFVLEWGDLAGAAGVIPAAAQDWRVVKCWYQSGTAGQDSNQKRGPRILVPELLLHDDALIRVDRDSRKNFQRLSFPDRTEYRDINGEDETTRQLWEYRFPVAEYPVRDAAALQPLTLRAKESRQFYLTLHVPEDAAPGEYRGTITFKSEGREVGTQPLEVRVLPFRLPPPATNYDVTRPFTSSIYHMTVVGDTPGDLNPYHRNFDQYRAELADLKAHGIDNPISLQMANIGRYDDAEKDVFVRMLQARRDAGMATDALYFFGACNINTGLDILDREGGRETLQNRCRLFRDWVRAGWGHDADVYFYGLDEASGDHLRQQLPAWQAIQEAGGKVMVTGYPAGGHFAIAGEVQDLLIAAHTPLREEAARWHSTGKKIWCYANPQAGVENPRLYRGNFGLIAYLADYDGTADFAYYLSFGDPWNDFDHPDWRDHNFVYPTTDGVVGTLAWEGYREGIDDIRYATRLRQAIRDSADRDKAAAAQAWLEHLDIDPETDLDAVRRQMIAWILQLQGAES